MFQSKIFNRVCNKVFELTILLRFPGANRLYWNYRADDVDNKWGAGKHDSLILENIILLLEANRILDIGCGSGRLFPLYAKLKVNEIVGQDISDKALQISRGRYRFPNIRLINASVLGLKFPNKYFDLIISNRALQHIFPSEIEDVIRKLSELGKYIYINEMSDTDCCRESFYLFKHDYKKLFKRYGFNIYQQGILEMQSWFLFEKDKRRNQ